MTRLVINGGSGNLAGRIVDLALEELSAKDITIVTRSPEKLADRSAQGVNVCAGNYNRPDLLEDAYRGADSMLLISSNDIGLRVEQHRNAIEAAKRAGVRHIVYTSTAGIHPGNPTPSMKDHIVTEKDLYACGLSFTALRNQTYADVFPEIETPIAIKKGHWNQLAGGGRLAPVDKQDIARCALRCMLDYERHAGAIYEITGPDLVSFRDIATLAADVFNAEIEYVEITPEELYAHFDGMGVPRCLSPDMKPHPQFHLWFSDEMVNAHRAFVQGYHAIRSDHVLFITGRQPISLREVFLASKLKMS